MNKIFLMGFIFLMATSCSPERSSDLEDSEAEVSKDKLEKYRRQYDVEEVVKACTYGCLYNYKLYRSAKSLLNSSVSLNQAQLNSVQVVCSRHCESTFLDDLKIKKDQESTLKEENSKKTFEGEDDVDVVEKKVEKKEEKIKDDLKGFEDL